MFSLKNYSRSVLRYLNGNESYREMGRSLGISDTVILNWVNQYKQNGLEAFLKRCTNYTLELEARIKQLEMENEYLKKLNALVQNKEKSQNKTKRK
ncbi:transposase [Bacillus cereus group sp. BfR-BA-01538]|uniref:transposase n=1 Tax=Bacillus cereus group sp. BfR-BA-01538 TaxID=2920373 RepID=UPI0024915907